MHLRDLSAFLTCFHASMSLFSWPSQSSILKFWNIVISGLNVAKYVFLNRYNKLAERGDNKLHTAKGISFEGNNLVEDMVCAALVLL